jgi:MFS family permease
VHPWYVSRLVPPPDVQVYYFIFKNRDMLIVGRIISGISVGLASAVIPIYQSEITAPAIRGRIISLQQWYTLTNRTSDVMINLRDT